MPPETVAAIFCWVVAVALLLWLPCAAAVAWLLRAARRGDPRVVADASEWDAHVAAALDVARERDDWELWAREVADR